MTISSRAALLFGTALLALPAIAGAQTTPGQTPDVTAADAAQEAAAAGVPDIVVTGTALGERRAIEAKRSANNLVEATYANDVGKLPDQNVAEAVRRLPGLSVANDQGEGRYVIIRGVNPNLVNVVLNGLTQPAPEPDGRQVKLDDIPSGLIGSVIVTKSLTAQQDANAIGGEVDIRTLTAFDRKERLFADARAAYGYYALNGRHPYEGDVQVGGRFGAEEQFGAVLSLNYSQRPIESENYQGSTLYRVPAASTGANQSDVVPDSNGLRDYNLTRTREGAVLNLDWRPSDRTQAFLRGTFSRFDDNETRDQFIIDNLSAFRNQTATAGTFTGRGSVRVRRREEDDNTKSVQGGGSVDLGFGTLDLAGAWTRAQKRDPLRSEYNFRTGGTALTVNYDVSTTPYDFIPTVQPNANRAAYSLNSVTYDVRLAVETLWQGRADLTVPIAIGDGSTIKAGVKYLHREKTNARDYQTYGLTAGRSFTLANVGFTGDTSFDDRYFLAERADYNAGQAYIAANPGVVTLNAAGSRVNSLANDYDVGEEIDAGYVMGTVKFGKLTLLPGMRVEHTRDRTKAKLITAAAALDEDYNAFGSKDYTDVFPGLNARLDATGNLVFRGAVTTAIGRPNYPDLSPYQSIDTTTSPRPTVTLGNPGLKPYKAVNLDADVEYYLPGQGLLSAGVFYKHIDDPIYTTTQIAGSGTFAGTPYSAIDIVQPQNIDEEYLFGVEANATVRATFLPSPFDGFGVSANYAHITGHATGTIAGATPRSGSIPLFFQSRDVGSAQLFYEKYGVAIRVAYSYRSPYLDTLGANAASDQYTDSNGQLDVNLSYQLRPQLTFFGQLLNLTDAPWRRYIGTRNQLVEREHYGFSVRWGAQLHF
jgi:TonB-dependent receptor